MSRVDLIKKFLIVGKEGQLSLDWQEATDTHRDLGLLIARNTVPDSPTASASADRLWMIKALQGEKIYAIKELRTITGCGLKDAKDTVELFLTRLAAIRIELMEEAAPASYGKDDFHESDEDLQYAAYRERQKDSPF